MSTFIKPTAKGQITLNKKLLAHLGAGPGDQLEVNTLPGGRLRLARVGTRKSMSDLVGLLTARAGPSITDRQIEDGIVRGAVEAYLDSEGADPDAADKAA